MYNGKSTSAKINTKSLTPEEAIKTKYKAANRANYVEPDTGVRREEVNALRNFWVLFTRCRGTGMG